MTENSSLTYLVTGGAGFIGSHLVDSLLADANTKEVRILDNFSSGRREHLASHAGNLKLKIHAVDLLALEKILPLFQGSDQVFHLAANPDARWGIDNTRLDLEQETIVTYNVLEAMRRNGVPRIVFSSSGTVYGDVGTTVTHELLGPALPVSLYGAGKVASEALVSAFCGTFGLCAVIFRFGNIVGERTTHGVIFDFIRQLAKSPGDLKVLGNGYQAKPYVYVRDLVDGLRFGKKICGRLEASKFDAFNLAPGGATTVRFIAEELNYTTRLHWAHQNPLRRIRAGLAGRRAAVPDGFFQICEGRLRPATDFRRGGARCHQPHPRMARQPSRSAGRFAAASRRRA